MKKYLQLIEQFHENNPVEIEFVKTQLKGGELQDEVEHILDFMYSNKHKKLEGLSYKLILAKTKKWDIKLQKVSSKDTEVEGVDYEEYLDFGDGFKIVKLISQNCYQREGKIMSHCVGGYFGRNTTIYSLRDSKNNPHCTIEDGNQIKGKGNGSIDPKYVDYIVKFLEKNGMIVGENEMKNLGYYNLDSIDKGLTSDSLYNGYIYQNKLDTIKDKDGEIYNGFGLLNIKKYVEIDVKMNIKWNFDLKVMLSYFFKKVKDTTSGDYSTSATSGDYSTSATSGYKSTSATSGNYSTSATSGNYSTSATSGDYSTSATSGYKSTSATSGDYSTSATSGNYSTSATSGDYSTSIANGKYNIAVANGFEARVKGKIGNYLVVSEYVKNEKYENILVDVKCMQVDGEIIKEDTLYILKNGIFTEIND